MQTSSQALSHTGPANSDSHPAEASRAADELNLKELRREGGAGEPGQALTFVIARSEATTQSSIVRGAMDCFGMALGCVASGELTSRAAVAPAGDRARDSSAARHPGCAGDTPGPRAARPAAAA